MTNTQNTKKQGTQNKMDTEYEKEAKDQNQRERSQDEQQAE
jgi:hypothetical protein